MSTTRYLVTAAQNATPVSPDAWATMLGAAAHLRAELLVVPYKYRNPTSLYTKGDRDDNWWAPEVVPYLAGDRRKLGRDLVLLGDAPVQATSPNPLRGLTAVAGGSASAIVGHPRVQMGCFPTMSGSPVKMLTTTGACTRPNFTPSALGKIGEHHHTLGALVVEVPSQGRPWLRNVTWSKKTGGMTDLDRRYSGRKVVKAPPPACLFTGDGHVRVMDPAVAQGTWGPGGIVSTLRPREIVWGDLLDAQTVNPHHALNPMIELAKWKAGALSAEDEAREAIEFAQDHTPAWAKSWIQFANHDDMLTRWFNATYLHGLKGQPWNARFFGELLVKLEAEARMTERGAITGPAFPVAARKYLHAKNVRFMPAGRPKLIRGIAVHIHGDRGPNGTRGSRRVFADLGHKSWIGHSHSPGTEGGCRQAGTSSYVPLDYNAGDPCSSWAQSHGLIHDDGKSQHVFMHDGEWRA